MLPWAAIGGAIGGFIFLIALLACGIFCCYRKRNTRAHDLENTTADISEPNDMKDDIVLLPSTAVDVTKQTELGHATKLEEAYPTPQVAATGEYGLTEASPQEPGIVACDQPLQQIAPCSFKLAMNGDEPIGGTLKEEQQARKEYRQALSAGNMVYLLEQAAPDGKCLKDIAKIQGS